MSIPIAPSGPGSSGPDPSEHSGPSPADVAGLVSECIIRLARTYEDTADQLVALAAALTGAQSPEWKGQAAEAYRRRLHELTEDLRGVAQGHLNMAAELRTGAAGLSAHIGAVEQFLDLGGLGASVLGVLSQAGQPVAQHELAGLLR